MENKEVFFKNVFYDRERNKVYVHEVVNGETVKFVEDYVRTIYVPDVNGCRKDIFGNRFKPMDVTYDQLKNLRNVFKNKLCESDIAEDVQYICKRYYPQGEMKPDFTSFNICTCDIEIETGSSGFSDKHKIKVKKLLNEFEEYLGDFQKSNKVEDYKVFDERKNKWVNFKDSCYYAVSEFPKPEEAKYPINLISCLSSKTGIVTTFGNRPYNGNNKSIDYRYHKDEVELLTEFIKYFRKNKFDILTGWNVKNFDIQYIINRCIALGVKYEKLSPYNIVNSRLGKVIQGRQNYYVTIAGITVLDYLELYDNFTFETLESYTLNFVGMYVVKEGKLDLDGQVNNEWATNWDNFVDYNIQDVLLVDKIDKKVKFINLSILMAHESLIPFERVLSSVAVIEGLIKRDNEEHNAVMPDRKTVSVDKWKQYKLFNSGKGRPNGIENDPDNDLDPEEIIENGVFKDFYIKGGHVEAYPGWYKNVISFDVTSEYPHMIMAYNISPETKVFNPTQEEIVKYNLIKSALNGIYFKPEEGILPRITNKIFHGRKHFKELKEQADKDGNKELSEFYDSMQHIRKIQVNSIYGVMGSKYFHFYDVDCARAVTRGGRQMIRYLANGFDSYFKNHFHLEFNKLFPERQMNDCPQLQNKVVCLIDTDSVLYNSIIKTCVGSYRIDALWNMFEERAKKKNKDIIQNGVDSYIIDVDSLYHRHKFQVHCLDMKNDTMAIGKVNYIKKHKVKKNFYKISFKKGLFGKQNSLKLFITEDHSIIVRRDFKISVKKPSEVIFGDEIHYNGSWGTYAKVEPAGVREEWVYDLEVENHHTFVANGIVVHNSNYLTVDEIFEKYFPDKTFEEYALEIEKRIMDPLIERMLNHYWKKQNLQNIIHFKREGIILDMIILAKKKYIKRIIQQEKKRYDTPKVKYTGVEVVRSDVPRFTRDELDSFYNNLFTLNRMDKKELRNGCLEKIWETKNKFKNLPIEKISFNSSVKEYTKYASPVEEYIENGLSYPPHCPIHTRASINYNYIIKKLNLPYQPVTNGSKVKYGYVVSKNKKLIDQDVIAYIGKFPEEFKEIFKVDWKKQFENSYISPIQKVFDVLDLGNANENENTKKFFEE